jgi:hypothetical protein
MHPNFLVSYTVRESEAEIFAVTLSTKPVLISLLRIQYLDSAQIHQYVYIHVQWCL